MHDIQVKKFDRHINEIIKGGKLPLITIYDNASDYPNKFVARLFIMDKPTRIVAIADTLEAIRSTIPEGLYRMDKDKYDLPSIVETYL